MSESRQTEKNAGSSAEIRIGISACLLGQKVRFDGGHKRDGFLNETLSQFVSFVPVCPEVDIGLGIPRETIRLIRSDDGVRLVGVKSEKDHTAAMEKYSRRKAAELKKQDLCGYILKKDSPSCGVFRVKVYDKNRVPSRTGRGLFAEALVTRNPLLPAEDEGRLRDPRLRDNFFVRVFAYRRLKTLFSGGWKAGDVVRFHTAEKLLLMSHDLSAYRELGRLVAHIKKQPRAEFAEKYQTGFMTALAKIATIRKHCNVLQHALGYFKKLASPDERKEIVETIEDFRHELVPLIVPITLIRHHVRFHAVEYLQGQTYLKPHPKELMLRNHV